MSELGKILVIFAFAVCAALGMAVLNTPNENSKAEAPGQSYCDAKLAPFGLRVASEADQTKADREKADLCQQIIMAEAAVNTAWWGKLQFYATLGGVAVAGWFAWLAYGVARRALFDLERPYVFLEVTSPGLTVDSGRTSFSLMHPGGFRYRFSNYGRTHARLVDATLRYRVVPQPRPAMPPPLIDTGEPDRVYPDGVVSALGSPHEEGENLAHVLPIDIYDAHAISRMQVFFLGRFRYLDVFGDTYVVGSCFVFDPRGLRFVRVGDDRYNYTRKE